MRWFLIDKYYDIHPKESLKALKLISYNEQFLEKYPSSAETFPETLLIEMMAQAGGVLSGVSINFRKEIILGKIEYADFFECVKAPAELVIDAKLISLDNKFSWTEMIMRSGEKRVAQAKIFFVVF